MEGSLDFSNTGTGTGTWDEKVFNVNRSKFTT